MDNTEITITIPANMVQFVNEHYGTAVSTYINSVDGLNSYGHLKLCGVCLSMLTRKCSRCGYDELWQPNDEDSKCLRHTYDNYK